MFPKDFRPRGLGCQNWPNTDGQWIDRHGTMCPPLPPRPLPPPLPSMVVLRPHPPQPPGYHGSRTNPALSVQQQGLPVLNNFSCGPLGTRVPSLHSTIGHRQHPKWQMWRKVIQVNCFRCGVVNVYDISSLHHCRRDGAKAYCLPPHQMMPVNSFSSGQVRLMNPGVIFHLELIYHRRMLSGNPFGTAVVSEECMDVLRQILSTGGANWIPRLHSILRIENRNLQSLYKTSLDLMIERNGSEVENERILWHGTAPENVLSICRTGFNRSHCGKNGCSYGKGSYFSTSFDVSCLYSLPDAKGRKYTFLCRVLTGFFHQGRPDLKEPLMRDAQNQFDSVVDNEWKPTKFVVFHDTHALPQYIVKLSSAL